MSEDSNENIQRPKVSIDVPTSDLINPELPTENITRTVGNFLYEEINTLGRERKKTTHPSGTSTEYLPDGSHTLNVIGRGYKVVHNGDDVIIHGSCNLTVNGDYNVTVNAGSDGYGGKYKIDCQEMEVTVRGNRTTHIAGKDKLDVSKSQATHIGGSRTDIVDETRTVRTNKTHKVINRQDFISRTNHNIKDVGLGAREVLTRLESSNIVSAGFHKQSAALGIDISSPLNVTISGLNIVNVATATSNNVATTAIVSNTASVFSTSGTNVVTAPTFTINSSAITATGIITCPDVVSFTGATLATHVHGGVTSGSSSTTLGV